MITIATESNPMSATGKSKNNFSYKSLLGGIIFMFSAVGAAFLIMISFNDELFSLTPIMLAPILFAFLLGVRSTERILQSQI